MNFYNAKGARKKMFRSAVTLVALASLAATGICEDKKTVTQP